MPTLKMWAKALKLLNLWTKPSEYRISVNEVLRELDLTIVNGSDIVSDPLLLRTWYRDTLTDFSSSWTWDEIAPGVEELNGISIV